MGFEDLLIYHIAFELATDLFNVSEGFPKEEEDTVNQLRRSSKAVYTNISEAYKKKNNKKTFVNKLNDSNTENIECRSWLRFATSCRYISGEMYKELIDKSNKIEKLIKQSIDNPKKFEAKS